MKVASYKQAPPFAIQIEFTEGCNLRCTFCGIQGITEKQGGPYKFLTTEVAVRIASQIAKAGWTSRIEFAMHGEPTLNPKFIDLVATFRKHLGKNQLMMTSNGSGLAKDTAVRVQALFNAGLNILALDDYKNVNIVPRVRQALPKGMRVYDYPSDSLDFSPHRRWPSSTQVVLIVQDLEEAAAGSHAKITNHCGCGGPLNSKQAGKRCAKPFRELSVRWDGTIAGCCNDWRGVYKIGDATTSSITDLWNNPAFTAMRRKLYYGERDFGACLGCDATSYRVGLLPDPLGKVTLPHATPQDMQAIKKAVGGQTLTQIVLRPWEGK